jgi:hypothetical protein
MCRHVSERIKIEIAKKNRVRGKVDLAENSNAQKIELAEKLSALKNRIRGNQNWQDFKHVEKLDLILTYMFLKNFWKDSFLQKI